MKIIKFLSGTGGVLVLIGILFLPLEGCGDEHLNGIQAIGMKEVPKELRVLLMFIFGTGLLMLVINNSTVRMGSSALGFLFLLTAHYLAHKTVVGMTMMLGSITTVIGFVMTWTASAVDYFSKKE